MGKLWWVSRVGLPIAGILGIAILQLVVPMGPLNRVALVISSIALGVVAGASISLGRSISRRKRDPDMASYFPLPGEILKKIQNYCKDCGAQFETTRWLKGYDPADGKELFGLTRRCPNYDKVRASMAKSGMSMFMLDSQNCGDLGAHHKRASRHTHANEWKTDVGCPACIDQMLGDGVITDSQASDLLRKTGLFN